MNVNPDGFSLLKIGAELWLVIIAMLGGIARYLDSYIRTGAPPKIALLTAHAMVSAFSGWMVAQVVVQFAPTWGMWAAGVGGYLGTQGLDMIAAFLRTWLNGQAGTGQSQVPSPAPPAPPAATVTAPPAKEQ